MRRLLLGTALLAAACGSREDATGADDSALTVPATTSPIPIEQVPEAAGFLGWRDDPTTISNPPPANHIAMSCADKSLYATHPQSVLKRYHRFSVGRYDNSKVRAESKVCKIAGSGLTTAGVHPCLLADELIYVMLSDTYVDTCGNFYRGYWDTTFLHHDENMGTLLSRGRTVYEHANSEFRGDTFDGQTYPLAVTDFAFLAPLEPDDAAKIEEAKKLAETTHTYDAATHLFTYIGTQ